MVEQQALAFGATESDLVKTISITGARPCRAIGP
jgi:hypothetical protein